MFITSFFSKFDPRASLASSWEKSSFEFEENLNNSSHISSEIKEGLIAEKQRIRQLFMDELPSKKDAIIVTITNDAIRSGRARIFHRYSLVSSEAKIFSGNRIKKRSFHSRTHR